VASFLSSLFYERDLFSRIGVTSNNIRPMDVSHLDFSETLPGFSSENVAETKRGRFSVLSEEYPLWMFHTRLLQGVFAIDSLNVYSQIMFYSAACWFHLQICTTDYVLV
jgi:hypothetical protein